MRRRSSTRRASGRWTLTAGSIGVAVLMFGQPAVADHQVVTAVTGSAFGYHADEITLFGGAQPDTGPTPTVELASDASNSPQTATAEFGVVEYGPATLFTSDEIVVHTEGALGDAGYVTSSADIDNINKATHPEVSGQTGSEILTADNLRSDCTADTTGTTATTTVTNGTVRTHAQAEDHDEGAVAIPTDPEPNYAVEGHVHLGTATDNFVIVFNEQIENPDGSITVNAAHEYFGATLDEGNIVDDPSSILQGDLYLGQSVCGVTVVAGEHPADLAVDIVSDAPDPAARGGEVTYTVELTNLGSEPASDTVLTLSLTQDAAGGARILSATAEDGTCDTRGRTPTCSLGTVAGEDTRTVTVTARAPNSPQATQMTLTAEVSFAGTDPDTSNDTDSETTTLQ